MKIIVLLSFLFSSFFCSTLIAYENKNATISCANVECTYPIPLTQDEYVLTTIDQAIYPAPLTSNIVQPASYFTSHLSKTGSFLANQFSKFRPLDITSTYGDYNVESGISSVKRNDIAPNSIGLQNNSKKLLSFFTISDIHITDAYSPVNFSLYGICGQDETCLNLYKFPSGITGAYPVLYSTQVLDAAMQTVNVLHKKEKFNLGIALGDEANNTQYNELRWFIDVLDGRIISPDSSDLSGQSEKYQASGLDTSIPWIVVKGNHDEFTIGVKPINNKLFNAYTGGDDLLIGDIFTAPQTLIIDNLYYMGLYTGLDTNGDMEFSFYGNKPCPGGVCPTTTSNRDRYSLSMNIDTSTNQDSSANWISEFFNTTSLPKGHGFTEDNKNSGLSYYSYEPNDDIKIIVIDDIDPASQTNNLPTMGYGYMDQIQYRWLVNELNQGQSHGKLMIIAAHSPINVLPVDSSGLAWTSISPVSQTQLLAKLHTYPNLIMWISGHRHVNAITLQPSPDPDHKEYGFWVVETGSLRDYPMSLRTFQIYRNPDNTISIVTKNVVPSVDLNSTTSPATFGVFRSMAHYQMYGTGTVDVPIYYNAELIKSITPSSSSGSNNNFLNMFLAGGVLAAILSLSVYSYY